MYDLIQFPQQPYEMWINFILRMKKQLAQGHTPGKELNQDPNPGGLIPKLTLSSAPCGISENPLFLGDQIRGMVGFSPGTLSFPSGLGPGLHHRPVH